MPRGRAGPRLLLAWSERWRATALAVPPVRPAADAELDAGLAALREVTSRLEDGAAAGQRRRWRWSGNSCSGERGAG